MVQQNASCHVLEQTGTEFWRHLEDVCINSLLEEKMFSSRFNAQTCDSLAPSNGYISIGFI